jgi:hypothetical protein
MALLALDPRRIGHAQQVSGRPYASFVLLLEELARP